MILSCNSCEKKFVVPDNAIGTNGRLVQCSSCGNQWRQFPINKEIKKEEKVFKIKSAPKKIQSSTKTTKREVKKKLDQIYTHQSIWQKNMGSKLIQSQSYKIK